VTIAPLIPNEDRLVHSKLPCLTTTALIANGNVLDTSAMAVAFVEKADRGWRENVSTNETALRESLVKVRTVSGTVISTNRWACRKGEADEIESPVARACKQRHTCSPGPIKKLFS
jgi:hypothetical protein